ncbi:hypothetical protein [Vibrio crassostreae]|uniref:hypothetical protein n=1 Tax=Vibrio crassostreae TaxID=246167 RepID=UPI001B301469|nr:hypothetical protein [Vibrio crassostreae]
MSELELEILNKLKLTRTRADRALAIISKDATLLTECDLIVEMIARINGLQSCEPSDLVDIHSDVFEVLGGITEYCAFIEKMSGGA